MRKAAPPCGAGWELEVASNTCTVSVERSRAQWLAGPLASPMAPGSGAMPRALGTPLSPLLGLERHTSTQRPQEPPGPRLERSGGGLVLLGGEQEQVTPEGPTPHSLHSDQGPCRNLAAPSAAVPESTSAPSPPTPYPGFDASPGLPAAPGDSPLGPGALRQRRSAPVCQRAHLPISLWPFQDPVAYTPDSALVSVCSSCTHYFFILPQDGSGLPPPSSLVHPICVQPCGIAWLVTVKINLVLLPLLTHSS